MIGNSVVFYTFMIVYEVMNRYLSKEYHKNVKYSTSQRVDAGSECHCFGTQGMLRL